MFRRHGVCLCLFLFAACTPLIAADKKTDPQEKLETAIPEAIRLLEEKEYATLLKNFVAPDDLKQITKTVPLDQLAKDFEESKAEPLLKMLKAIKDVKPTMEDNGKKATYKPKEGEEDGKPLSFQKVGKRWYMRN